MPTIAECVAIATKQCADVSQSSMPTIAECVAIATKQCAEHTCDISLFQRDLPIFCQFCRKSPYLNFRKSLYNLYISLFQISDLPTKS